MLGAGVDLRGGARVLRPRDGAPKRIGHAAGDRIVLGRRREDRQTRCRGHVRDRVLARRAREQHQGLDAGPPRRLVRQDHASATGPADTQTRLVDTRLRDEILERHVGVTGRFLQQRRESARHPLAAAVAEPPQVERQHMDSRLDERRRDAGPGGAIHVALMNEQQAGSGTAGRRVGRLQGHPVGSLEIHVLRLRRRGCGNDETNERGGDESGDSHDISFVRCPRALARTTVRKGHYSGVS